MINHKTGAKSGLNTTQQASSAANVSVAQLAQQTGVSVERLMIQLNNANISVSGPDAIIAEQDKEKLLYYLQAHHGAQNKQASSKIILRRASTSQIKVSGGQGSNKTVSVQVRRKRTYVKEPVIPASQPESKVEPEVVTVSIPPATDIVASIESPTVAPAATVVVDDKPKEVFAAVKTPDVVPDAKYLGEEFDEKPKKKKKTRISAPNTKDINSGMEKLLRHGGNLNIVLNQTEDDGVNLHRRRHKPKKINHTANIAVQAFQRPTTPMLYEVSIPSSIAITDLAQKMAVKVTEVIKVLLKLGMSATAHQIIDQETAILVVEEMGHKAKVVNADALEKALIADMQSTVPAQPRSPVVTIMGHVDHGKTTLLDYIRRSKVVAQEAGGITQHIGAYHVVSANGGVTFLDTPGHSAFTAMRARGAKLTDIVVLIVAADDGVMPQTIEALEHAKAAKVPIIVAISKIDKHGGDLDAIKNTLSKHDLLPEEWGGDTMYIAISAYTGQNIDLLLDSILLQAEMLQLQAPASGPASGIVLESRLDKGRGAVASVLVQQGLLQRGDIILSGCEYGRVRALFSENGQQVASAGPSMPVEVLGWSAAPRAGEIFAVVPDEKRARELAAFRQDKARAADFAKQHVPTLDNLLQKMGEQQSTKILNVIIKADVHGSAEALADALVKIATPEITIKIIAAGVGGIRASDINLALASQAIIIGFNVRADIEARKLIENSGVIVRYHNIIYAIIEQVKEIMSGYLAPDITDKILGVAEVREMFRASKHGMVAGCMVLDGLIKRNSLARVLRNQVVVYDGAIESLRRFKEDIAEVRVGLECGLTLRDYQDIKVGDQIEVFERIATKRTVA